MAPQREGVEVEVFENHPRKPEFLTLTNAGNNRVFVGSANNRPRRVEPADGDDFRARRMGLTQPGGSPNVIGFGEGALDGVWSFFWTRYDSERGIYSPRSSAVQYVEENLLENRTVIIDDEGEGLSQGEQPVSEGTLVLGVDLVTPDTNIEYDRYTFPFKLRGQGSSQYQSGAVYTSITFKMKKFNSNPLSGIVEVRLDGNVAARILASTLTETMEDYRFPIFTPITVGASEVDVVVEVRWYREGQTDNCIQLRGVFEDENTFQLSADDTVPSFEDFLAAGFRISLFDAGGYATYTEAYDAFSVEQNAEAIRMAFPQDDNFFPLYYFSKDQWVYSGYREDGVRLNPNFPATPSPYEESRFQTGTVSTSLDFFGGSFGQQQFESQIQEFRSGFYRRATWSVVPMTDIVASQLRPERVYVIVWIAGEQKLGASISRAGLYSNRYGSTWVSSRDSIRFTWDEPSIVPDDVIGQPFALTKNVDGTEFVYFTGVVGNATASFIEVIRYRFRSYRGDWPFDTPKFEANDTVRLEAIRGTVGEYSRRKTNLSTEIITIEPFEGPIWFLFNGNSNPIENSVSIGPPTGREVDISGQTTPRFEDPGALMFKSIDSVLGDSATDSYDQVAFIGYSYVDGEFYVLQKWGIDDEPTSDFNTENVLINSEFDEDAAWILGAGWDISSDRLNHTAGDTEEAAQVTVVAENDRVVLALTLGGTTAGSVEVFIGTHSLGTFDEDGEFQVSDTVTDGGRLRFVPTTDFDGYIESVDLRIQIAIYRINSAPKTEIYTPNIWNPFPAVRVLDTIDTGGVRIAVGAGQQGFDTFVDMTRLEAFSPSARLTSAGVLTASVPLYEYRDGTYLAIGYDSSGNELVRAFLHDSGDTGDPDHEGTGIGGVTLTANQIQLCRDFERTELFTSDEDGTGDWEAQRWEIRRQVVAHVERNNRNVDLSHDVDNEIPAKVGDQYWAQQELYVQGVEGSGVIIKPATKDGNFRGSLDDEETKGDQIILLSPWRHGTGHGLIEVSANNKRIFFGRTDFIARECTGPGYWYDLNSNYPIKTIKAQGERLVVICEKDEVFVVSPTGGFPVDPVNLVGVIGFNIRQFFSDEKFSHPFTCVSMSTFSFPTRSVGFLGSDGPYAFDFTSVRNLASNMNRVDWGEKDQQSLRMATATVDQSHPYFSLVRIAGFSQWDDTDKRDQQYGYSYDNETWFDFTDQCQNLDYIASALHVDGSSRVIFGAYGRIYSYGMQGVEGREDPNRDIYLFPYVGGTQFGTLDGLEDPLFPDEGNVVYDEDAVFTPFADGYIWKGTGIQVAKIDQTDGTVEWAEVTERLRSSTLKVTPRSTWTMVAGHTYSYIVGAAPFKIRLPDEVARGGFVQVGLEEFTVDMSDDSASGFVWPFWINFYKSDATPDLPDAATYTERFLSTDLQPMWGKKHLQISSDYAFGFEIEGVIPPDGNIHLDSVTMKWRYTT